MKKPDDPFEQIDLKSATQRAKCAETDPETVKMIEDYINLGREFYARGDMYAAVLWAWYAGTMVAKLVNRSVDPLRDTQGQALRLVEVAKKHLKPGKLMQGKSTNRRKGDKTIAKERWNSLFQSVTDSRKWRPDQQADYIYKHHGSDFKITRATLGK